MVESGTIAPTVVVAAGAGAAAAPPLAAAEVARELKLAAAAGVDEPSPGEALTSWPPEVGNTAVAPEDPLAVDVGADDPPPVPPVAVEVLAPAAGSAIAVGMPAALVAFT